jgi:hypothetical protein
MIAGRLCHDGSGTFGEIVRCRIDSARAWRRNETRELGLIPALRVNCEPACPTSAREKPILRDLTIEWAGNLP